MGRNKNYDTENENNDDFEFEEKEIKEVKPKPTVKSVNLRVSLKKGVLDNLTVQLVSGLGILDKKHPSLDLENVSSEDYRDLKRNRNLEVIKKEV
jgi:hypothetical protein